MRLDLLQKVSVMNEIVMPMAIVLLFMPPCMVWYAPEIMPLIYLIQKGIFLICALYFIKYKLFKNVYFWLLTAYILWLIALTLVNGNKFNEIGSYLNIFSVGVITMYCIDRNPKKFTGYVAFIFVLWMFLNTLFWKEGGMYLNSNGQMCFVLGTKTSLTYYQIVACCFTGMYGQFVEDGKKYKVKILYSVLIASTVVWNVRQPISTSILCLIAYFMLLFLNRTQNTLVDKFFKIGYIATIALNIGIVFFGAQMLFANFITNVLHESADLNYRTTIWKVVLAKIADNPIWGHGLNTGTFFSFDNGTSSFNQATHNFLLYLLFVSGIIGTIYFIFLCMLAIRKTNRKDRMLGRILNIVMICFGMMWITEQLKSFDMIYMCLLSFVCAEKKHKLFDLDVELLDERKK